MADARNVPYLIQYAQLLYHLKGEREKARQVAEEIRRIDPEHWWIIMYADKYLTPTQVSFTSIVGPMHLFTRSLLPL